MCNNLILDMCNNLTLDMCKDLNPLGSNQVGFPNTGNNIGFGGPSGSGGPNLLPILDLNKTPELSLEPESQMSDDIRVNLTDGDLQNIKDTSNNLRHSYNHRHIVMQQKLFLRTSTMLYEFQKNPAYYDKTEVQFIHDGLTNVRSLFPKLPVIIDENEYRLELYHDSNKIYKLYFISNDPDCFSHAKSISMTNQVRYFGTENKLSLMNDILDNQNKHHIDNGSGEVSTSKYLTGEFKNSFNKFGRPVLIMDIKNILNPR